MRPDTLPDPQPAVAAGESTLEPETDAARPGRTLARDGRSESRTRQLHSLLRDCGATAVVRGECLAPAVRSGDRVWFDSRRRPRSGDLVVFVDRQRRLVVHRFLGRIPGRSGWRYVTAADASASMDDPVERSELLGVVHRVSGAGRSFTCEASLRRRSAALARLAELIARRALVSTRGRLRVTAARWTRRARA